MSFFRLYVVCALLVYTHSSHQRLPENDSGHFFIFENGGKELREAVPIADLQRYSSVEELTAAVNGTRLWTATGEHLTNTSSIRNGDRLFDVKPMQHFFWPPLRLGHKYNIEVEPSKVVTMETMSLVPIVFKISEFLSSAEADHFVSIASTRLEESMVGVEGKRDKDRNSRTAWISVMHDEIVGAIDRRIGRLLRIPFSEFVKLSEDYQVVSYKVGEQYKPHHDYYEPGKDEENYEGLEDHVAGRNRMLTFLIYLSDVEEGAGGATNFPRSRNNIPTFDCTRGLSVTPVKGDAILFYDLKPLGTVPGVNAQDEMSLHCGCKVRWGRKWISNKWVHNWVRSYGDNVF